MTKLETKTPSRRQLHDALLELNPQDMIRVGLEIRKASYRNPKLYFKEDTGGEFIEFNVNQFDSELRSHIWSFLQSDH